MNSDKLEIEEFLDHIDEWKAKVSKELRGMTPAQRKAFWHRIHEEARVRGLNVMEPEKPERPAKRPAKPIRRSG